MVNDDFSRELHPGYLAIVVATGLLATFIAQLVPEELSAAGVVLILVILVVGTLIYFSRLPARRHEPLLSYLRFTLIALFMGIIIGLGSRLIPLVLIPGVYIPDGLAEPFQLPSRMSFTLHESVYSGLITLIAVIAFWTSRRVLRPVTFVVAAMAGAVVVESAIPLHMGLEVVGFDAGLTYVTWGGLGVSVVLGNALLPAAVTEMKRFFRRSTPGEASEGGGRS